MIPIKQFIENCNIWNILSYEQRIKFLLNQGYYIYNENTSANFSNYYKYYHWCNANLNKDDFVFLNISLFFTSKQFAVLMRLSVDT